jgi:hypothetical protein
MKKRSLIKFYKRNSLVYALPQKMLFFPRLVNLRYVLISGIFLSILLLGFYVFQITSVISAGYQIQDSQETANRFLQENKTLEINSARTNSLAEVSQKIQELGFEKMSRVYYIQMLESSVAAVNNKIQ